MSGDRTTGLAAGSSAPSAADRQPAATLRSRVGLWLRADARRLVAAGVPHLFTALALTQGISLIRRVVLAWILSKAELGQMTYVMQIADWLAIVVDLGLTTALLKYAAEPVSDQQRRKLYCAGLQWGALSASIGGLIYMGVVWACRVPADQVIRAYLLAVTPYIPLAAIVKLPLVFMQARKEIRRSARYTAATQVLSLVVLVGATYAWGLRGFFTAVIVAPASNLALLLYATRAELRWYLPSVTLLRRLLGFGFFSVLANATGYANAAAAVVLLRFFTASDELLGLYAIGILVSSGLRLLPGSLMQTAFPYLSGLLREPMRLRSRMRELCLKQTLVLAAVAAAWDILGRVALHVVFRGKYDEAYAVSVVLALAVVPYAAGAPAGQTLLALGRVRANFLFSTVLLALNVIGCCLLIPRWGILGAAAASVGAQVVECGCALIYASRVLRHGAPAPLLADAPTGAGTPGT